MTPRPAACAADVPDPVDRLLPDELIRPLVPRGVARAGGVARTGSVASRARIIPGRRGWGGRHRGRGRALLMC
ncbi:hypothetical protein B5P19_01610 [Clavibacter sepedonicus]|nr:hypothetical protein B5P19_01610 [Clavibacter sepedonicus]OQJ55306.1 hypothetical protein B5P20_15300 [Clavibacter sepedonicus]